MMAFYDRHVCRVPWPDRLQRTFDGLAANPERPEAVLALLRDWLARAEAGA